MGNEPNRTAEALAETARTNRDEHHRWTRAHRLESDLRHWLDTLHEYDRHDHVFTVGDIEDTIKSILGDD